MGFMANGRSVDLDSFLGTLYLYDGQSKLLKHCLLSLSWTERAYVRVF